MANRLSVSTVPLKKFYDPYLFFKNKVALFGMKILSHTFFYILMIMAISYGCKNNINIHSNKKTIVVSQNSLVNVDVFKDNVSEKIIPIIEESKNNDDKDDKDSSDSQIENSTLFEIVVDNTPSRVKGNVYVFWGNLQEEMGQHEWNEFFLITRYLTKRGYKVFLNPYAKVIDLQQALQDKNAELITWSSHGNGGVLHDKNLNPLPFDIFNVNNPNIKQIIISACDGELIRSNYVFNPINKFITWVGSTNSDEFINYFNSKEWINDFN